MEEFIDLEYTLQKNIRSLLTEAGPKIVAAFQGGGPEMSNAVVDEFAPIAFSVYRELDVPNRTFERYHDPDFPRVLLDPMTVLNRAEGRDDGINDFEFWKHVDMIKTLCDYLALRFGGVYAESAFRN